jgi:hypothetical protein
VTNGIGGPRCPTWSGRTKAGGVQAVLTLGANKNENAPSSSLTLRRYRTATSPASGKRCSVPATRRAVVTPSMSMVPEIRTGWLGHAGTAPSRRYAHQGTVEQHGLCRWSVPSRSWLHEPDAVARPFPALSRHQQHRPISRYVCRRDICHLRRFPQVIAEDAAYGPFNVAFSHRQDRSRGVHAGSAGVPGVGGMRSPARWRRDSS